MRGDICMNECEMRQPLYAANLFIICSFSWKHGLFILVTEKTSRTTVWFDRIHESCYIRLTSSVFQAQGQSVSMSYAMHWS